MKLDPWWIIVFDDNNHADSSSGISGELIDNQLNTIFSGWTQFALNKQPGEFRWFQIDRFQGNPDDIIGSILNFLNNFSPFSPHGGHNANRPSLTVEELNSENISVVLIGDVRSLTVQNFYHLLGKIIRIRRRNLFSERALKSYGFLYIPQELLGFKENVREACISFLLQLNTLQNEAVIAERPFNNLVIVQDKNADRVNKGGFVNLPEGKIPHLIAQLVLHLACSDSSILEDNRTSPEHCWTQLGSIALYFDQKNLLSHLAAKIGESLINDFKDVDRKPWVDSQTLDAVITDKGFKKEISPANLFKKLVSSPERPFFNFSSRIWAYPEKISPYHFWTPRLLKLYFGFYVKNLTVRLVEYGRLFLSRSFQEFQWYLERQQKEILEGTTEYSGLKSYIQEISEYHWREDSLACGLKQYEQMLTRLRNIIAEQQKHLKSELFQLEEFSNLMVFPISRYLQSFYENASEEFTIEEEKKIIDQIRQILSVHPLPLALFLRATIIGILLFFLLSPFLDFFSPTVVNLDWLISNNLFMFLLSFGIPFIIALWRYNIKTWRWIRKLIKKYIASILRHAQARAREKVFLGIEDIYEQLDEFCQQLLAGAEIIRKEWHYPDVPESAMVPTEFQISLTGSVDDTAILNVPPHYEITGYQRTFTQLTDDEKAVLLRAGLHSLHTASSTNDRLYLWQYLLQKKFAQANQILVDYCIKLLQENTRDIFYWLEHGANPRAFDNLIAWSYPSGILQENVFTIPPYYECRSIKGEDFSFPSQTNFQGSFSTIKIPDYISLASIRYLDTLSLWFWGTNYEEQKKIIKKTYQYMDLSAKITLALGSHENRAALFSFSNQPYFIPNDLLGELTSFREELLKKITT